MASEKGDTSESVLPPLTILSDGTPPIVHTVLSKSLIFSQILTKSDDIHAMVGGFAIKSPAYRQVSVTITNFIDGPIAHLL